MPARRAGGRPPHADQDAPLCHASHVRREHALGEPHLARRHAPRRRVPRLRRPRLCVRVVVVIGYGGADARVPPCPPRPHAARYDEREQGCRARIRV